MSDKCTLTVNINVADLEKVKESGAFDMDSITFSEYPDERTAAVGLEELEADGGGEAILDKLRAAGIPFHGGHGAGDEYDPEDFAFDGTEFVEVQTSRDGDFLVPVNLETFTPDPETIAKLKLFKEINAWAELLVATPRVPTITMPE